MSNVVFTQAARAELIDAQDWYEGEAQGLGRRFRAAIVTAIERMSANPAQFPVVFKNLRRALLRQFPYTLFFHYRTRHAACDCLLPREPRCAPVAAAHLTKKR